MASEITMRQVAPAWGFGRALRLWRLVLAAWIVPTVLFSLPLLAVVRMVAPWYGSMPLGGTAPGDAVLVGAWGLGRLGGVVGLLAAVALVLAWSWTILWHAGITGWYGLGGGRPFALGEMVGLGVLRWFRYCRLSLVGLAATGVLAAGLSSPFFVLAKNAKRAMEETRMVNLQLAGGAVMVLVILVCWTAFLRGAWELAAPGRRSAALAWLRGLGGAVTDLPRSAGTVLLWGVFLGGFAFLPLLAGIRFSGLGGTPGWFVLAGISHLLAAFCAVGLFLSFAPVSGLVVEAVPDEEPRVPARGDIPPGPAAPPREPESRDEDFEELFELERS